MQFNILESNNLTAVDKMKLFNVGMRRENLKACSEAKLWDFRNVCISEKLPTALFAVENELVRRGLLSQTTATTPANNSASFTQTSTIQQEIVELLSKINVDPADTSFIIDNVEKSNWVDIFQHMLDSLRSEKDDAIFKIYTTIYLVTLITLGRPVEAQKICDLVKSRLNWSTSDIKLLLNSFKDSNALMQRFEQSINYSIQNKSHSNESMIESIEKHTDLNAKLWDKNGRLKKEVHDKILQIANEFMNNLKDDGIRFDLKDIRIVGSNCSYNYTKNSDLDVHLIADSSSLKCPDDLYPLLYSSYRSIFNKNLNIDFYGIPVEVYVEVE